MTETEDRGRLLARIDMLKAEIERLQTELASGYDVLRACAVVGLEVEARLTNVVDHWADTEARSAEAHAVYQKEAHRRIDVRHPDSYNDLSEATKEWDRVLVRWVHETCRTLAGQKEAVAGSPTDVRAKLTRAYIALDLAWGLVANAGGGDWGKESRTWKEAAEAWRDEYWDVITADVTRRAKE